jgi:guanylate kinase
VTYGSDSTDNDTNGLIFVFSAPSGGGKTSVLHGILGRHPEMEFSVSVTTRHPRGAERNGIDYRFVTDGEFDDLVSSDAFVEWAAVHGFRYGTLKSVIEKARQSGKTIIMDTDTVGAFNIKKQFPDAVLIFLVPPSPEILLRRLKDRQTESPDRLEKRLSVVPDEIREMTRYDYIVLNDSLEAAVDRVHAIIVAENLKTKKIAPKLSAWRKYIDE